MRSSAPVAQGETIAGKYQVEKVLGEGAMGLVVAAWHLALQQRVAIKFLLAEVTAAHDDAAERFRREARAAARIRSEHVCRVLDVGTLDSGVPFMVMEYLDGCDLSEELERQGRLSTADAIEYVLQASEALAEAHAAGIVHRDLKPANLFLAKRADGSRAIKVLDFGVSKSLADASVSHLSLTKTATLVGSPLYMSPEQLESSKDVDARTDIWALGTILYELLAGRTPFDGSSIPQLVNSVLYAEPRPMADLGVSIDPELEAVVLLALKKQRDDRFGSVAELAEALLPFAPEHAHVSVARIARVLGPTGRSEASRSRASKARATTSPDDPAAMSARAPASKRWLWPALALALALIGIAFSLAQRASAPATKVLAAEHVLLPAPARVAAKDAGVKTAAAQPPPPSAAAPVAPAPVTPAPVTPAPTTAVATTGTPESPVPSAALNPRKHRDTIGAPALPGAPAPATDGVSDFGGRR